jgi:hypothetical protein
MTGLGQRRHSAAENAAAENAAAAVAENVPARMSLVVAFGVDVLAVESQPRLQDLAHLADHVG